jgi:hypothetical protein
VRLAAVAAAPGVVDLSLELGQISATYFSKAAEILVKSRYASDANAGKVRKIRSHNWLPLLRDG